MQCTQRIELNELIKRVKPFCLQGRVASYIPALGMAEPSDLSISIYSEDGLQTSNESEKSFTLQSISKVLTLAIAIYDLGEDEVFRKVGMEPSGDPFNSIAKLENLKPAKPLNPMINAGALTVTSMIKGNGSEEKFKRILTLVRKMACNPNIRYNHLVAESEYQSAFLNRSLCYFLKEHHIINGEVEQLLDVYTKQCAIELNCNDLARIGYVLANGGTDPFTGNEILPRRIVRIITTFMVTCGMYNESGEFAIKVGIPAKSGISGAILGVVPNKMGIGIYGPSLNEKGNSIGGTKLLESLSSQLNLNIF